MSKISKFVKLNKDILLEYVYDDGNLLSEDYNILINSKDIKRSYIASDSTGTGNSQINQLFITNQIEGKMGKINPDYYPFLTIKNYSDSTPIKHDVLKIHTPINWTFGEYLGFYIRVYTYDSQNKIEYDLSNFYFDMTDVSQQYLMNFTSPPLLFQEKLWGKNIKLEIPSVNQISSQRENGLTIENSLNYNLTGGVGLSITSPIFISFNFIKNIQTIGGITTFTLENGYITSLPQTPEFESLGLKIENSKNGDFFEIYGTYNGNISEFKKFIDDSVLNGNRYFVQYDITIYEQNIRGKTMTVTLTSGFNEPVEYRPIIKYSTTTAVIDVEMRLIDAVDDSIIIRRASYGMLQDEVSKYSLNLMKINLSNVYKPKIYNIKSSINPGLVGVSNAFGVIPVNNNPKSPPMPKIDINMISGNNNGATNNVVVEKVEVPYPVLIDRFNIMAKSDSSILDGKTFFGFGKMQILLYPFDNIVGFSIASGRVDQPEYLDMSGYSEIKFIIKNDSNTVSFTPYIDSEEIDLTIGLISFKISESKFGQIKKIYNSGINVFYITGTNNSTTSVIYTGLFKIYDDVDNLQELNQQIDSNPDIILDPTPQRQTAIVTTRILEEDDQPIPAKKSASRSSEPAANQTSTPKTIYYDSDLNRKDIESGNFKI